MIELVSELATLLRRQGVRCGPAEVLDATRALAHVGLSDPALVRAALRATLVKRASDHALFDELWSLVFSSHASIEASFEQALLARGASPEELEALLAALATEMAHLSPLARAALGLSRGGLERLLRLALADLDLSKMSSPLQTGFFAVRLQGALGISGAEQELAALAGPLARKLGAERAAEVLAAAEEALRSLRGSLRDRVEEELARRSTRRPGTTESMAEKPFGAMNEEELARLHEQVRRLADKLRTQASLRPKRARRGRLDVRRTLRRSLVAGGVPFSLAWRRRKPDRPRLCILCDISDSVRHVSHFMLLLTYLLQDRFSKVRSFVFVSDLAEATSLFREHPIDRAAALAQRGDIVNVYANSNFGRAFAQFCGRYLEAVDARTTVIVIGDGRNNYNPPRAALLGDIRRRARRLLWLTPEQRETWAFGDSVLYAYEPHCDRIEVVYNLATLERAIEGLGL